MPLFGPDQLTYAWGKFNPERAIEVSLKPSSSRARSRRSTTKAAPRPAWARGGDLAIDIMALLAREKVDEVWPKLDP